MREFILGSRIQKVQALKRRFDNERASKVSVLKQAYFLSYNAICVMIPQKKQYQSVKHIQPAITAPTTALSRVFFR
jgi:hypothetical protein